MAFTIDFNVGEAKTKLEDLAKAVDAVGDKATVSSGKLQGFGASAKELQEFAKSVQGAGEAIRKIAGSAKDIKKTSDEVKRLGQESKTASEHVSRVGTATKTTTSAYKGMMSVLGGVTKEQLRLKKVEEAQAASTLGATKAINEQNKALSALAKKNSDAAKTSVMAQKQTSSALGMTVRSMAEVTASQNTMKHAMLGANKEVYEQNKALRELAESNTKTASTISSSHKTLGEALGYSNSKMRRAAESQVVSKNASMGATAEINKQNKALRELARANAEAAKSATMSTTNFSSSMGGSKADRDALDLQKRISAARMSHTKEIHTQNAALRELARTNTEASKGSVIGYKGLSAALGMTRQTTMELAGSQGQLSHAMLGANKTVYEANAALRQLAEANTAAAQSAKMATSSFSQGMGGNAKEKEALELQRKITAARMGHTKEINDQNSALRALAKANAEANKAATILPKNKISGTGSALGMNNVRNLKAESDAVKQLERYNSQLAKGQQIVAASHEKNAKAAAKATAANNKLGTATKNLNKHLIDQDQYSAGLRASLNALGTHMGIFTGRTIATATVFYSIVTAIKSMIVAGSDFSREMIRANAVMGATKQEAGQLEAKVRSLAANTIFTATQVSEGLTFLGMAGLSAKESFYALEPSLNIAKIGMISFAESADIVTNVLRAFKLDAEELQGVADDLATAITSTNATILQLAKSISYVGPIADAAGGSLREVISILSVMHDVGIKSSRAGTALRRAYSNLLAPTNKVASTLTKLGVATTDANGQMRTMTGILTDIANNGATAGDIVKMFGVRASAAMTAVISDIRSLNPKLKEMLGLLDNNAGAAASLGESFENYLGADARKLVSALQEKMIEVFKINEKGFRQLMKDLRAFIESINSEAVGAFIDKITRLTLAFAHLSDVIFGLAALTILKSFWGLLTAGALAGVEQVGKLNKTLKKSDKELGKVGKAAKAAAKKFSFLGSAVSFLGGPWMKFIGIALSVAGAMWAVSKAFDGTSEAAGKATEKMSKHFDEQVKMQKLINLDPRSLLTATTLPKDTYDFLFPNNGSSVESTHLEKTRKELANDEADILQRIRDINAYAESAPKQIAAIQAKIKMPNLYSKGEINGFKDDISIIEAVVKQAEAKSMFLADRLLVVRGKFADLTEFKTNKEGIDNRVDLQKDIDDIYSTFDLDSQVKAIERSADSATKAVKDIADAGGMTRKKEMERLNAIAAHARSEVKALIDAEQSQLRDKEQNIMEKMGLPADHKFKSLGKSNVDGRDIPDIKTTDGAGELRKVVEQMNELSDKAAELNLNFSDQMRGNVSDYMKALVSDGKFKTAAASLSKYNSKLKEKTAVIYLDIEAMKKAGKGVKSYVEASEQQKMIDTDNLILKQQHAIAEAKRLKKSNEFIESLKVKLVWMKAERAELEKNIATIEAARKAKSDEEKRQDYIEELKQKDFLPEKIKDRYDYADNAQKMKDFYMMQYNLKEEDLAGHAEYLEAKKMLDLEYWESQNEGWNEFFNSLGDNISDALAQLLIYKEGWVDVREAIAIGVAQSAIKALVDIGTTFMKNHLAKMFAKKAEIAQDTADSMVRQGLIIKEKTTEVTANAAAGAASRAAGAQGEAMIAALIGEGNAMLASWLPAATAVNVASFGAAAIAATATMAVAQAAATAGAVGSGYAAGAGGAAVAGRESGGPVQANQPYLVGEGGKAELFIPDTSGVVVSNKDLNNVNSPFNKGSDGSESESNIKIVNAIDPEFIEDYLGGQEGERVILNVIRKNKGKF